GRSTLELLGRLPHRYRGPPTCGACWRRLLERLGNSRGSRADARGPPTPAGEPTLCRELGTMSGRPVVAARAAARPAGASLHAGVSARSAPLSPLPGPGTRV